MLDGNDFSRLLVNSLVAAMVSITMRRKSVSSFLHNTEAPRPKFLEDLVLTRHRAFCRHDSKQQRKNVESSEAIRQELHVGARCGRMDRSVRSCVEDVDVKCAVLLHQQRAWAKRSYQLFEKKIRPQWIKKRNC